MHIKSALSRGKNVLRCFPPTADLPRHACFGEPPNKDVYAGRSSEILDHECDGSLEDFAEAHREFILDLLKVTPRPTESTISSAISRIGKMLLWPGNRCSSKTRLACCCGSQELFEVIFDRSTAGTVHFSYLQGLCRVAALMNSRPKFGGA